MKSDYLKYKVNHRKFADFLSAVEYAVTVNGQVISIANNEIVWPQGEQSCNS